MREIADQTRNRWRSILPMFGVGSEYLGGKHGPCPICEGKDRFRFDDKDGRGTFFCSVCNPGDGMRLVMLKTGMSFADAAQAIRERLGETSTAAAPPKMDSKQARQAAAQLWQSAVPIFHDEASVYLASRGLREPYPLALRFCTAARVTGVAGINALPAMLALVSDPDGKSVNVHRTYLKHGAKAPIQSSRRMMAGEVPEGSAIRLAEHKGILGIAEGIETALAASRDFGIPCWSAIDEGKLAKFAVPADVTELHIFGDNDINFVGQQAAFTLGRRTMAMKERPAIVKIHIPEMVGTDWADKSERIAA